MLHFPSPSIFKSVTFATCTSTRTRTYTHKAPHAHTVFPLVYTKTAGEREREEVNITLLKNAEEVYVAIEQEKVGVEGHLV